MTNFELSQPDSTVIQAGKNAFTIGIATISNPYRKNQRLFKLWSIGHKKAKFEDDQKRTPAGRYPIYFEPMVVKPLCIRCGVPTDNSCPICGDTYIQTEEE